MPLIVEYDAFWTRYFYRLHRLEQKHAQFQQLTQRSLAAQAAEEEVRGAPSGCIRRPPPCTGTLLLPVLAAAGPALPCVEPGCLAGSVALRRAACPIFDSPMAAIARPAGGLELG